MFSGIESGLADQKCFKLGAGVGQRRGGEELGECTKSPRGEEMLACLRVRKCKFALRHVCVSGLDNGEVAKKGRLPRTGRAVERNSIVITGK